MNHGIYAMSHVQLAEAYTKADKAGAHETRERIWKELMRRGGVPVEQIAEMGVAA